MKSIKVILIIAISVLITSCGAIHNGAISSSSINRNVVYDDIAMGVSKTYKVLGIGGMSRNTLIMEAKCNMIWNRPLSKNEEYANITIDFKRSYFLIFTQTRVTIIADVVRFTGDTVSEVYSKKYRNRIESKNYENDLFYLGDTVVNLFLKEGVISSFVNNNKVKITYKTRDGELKTENRFYKSIYTDRKSYKGLKVGDSYNYCMPGSSVKISAKIIAFGLKNLLIENAQGNIYAIPYSEQ